MIEKILEQAIKNMLNSNTSDILKEFYEKFDDMFGSGMVGRVGEMYTEQQLQIIKMLGKNGKILKNIYIPKSNGETTEIDLLFITEKGIFVIESKNYSGWIFGDEKSNQWTSSFPNGEKYRFYNPIMQNRTHIKWLSRYINEEIPMFSLIVFSERCEIKKMQVYSPNIAVLNRNKLSHAIKKFWEKSDFTMSTEKIEGIYSSLLPLTNVDSKTKKEHKTNVKSTIENTENICPLCKNKLVLRTAKKGSNAGNQFYGCSNFPKCRFTKNIS